MVYVASLLAAREKPNPALTSYKIDDVSVVHYMITADFNHDGLPDLAISTSKGVVVLLGKGDGTFKPPVITTLPGTFRSSRSRNLLIL